MNTYFETLLNQAILRCEGIDTSKNNFIEIYPFTTENINGYISQFNLNNKSLLTVGSSSDQAINAFLYGAKNQTIYDINPYTKFYFYLKKAGIMCLEYDEFFDFFCYIDYPKIFKVNTNVFDKNIYNKLKDCLRLLNYEAFLFWDELFNLYNGETIRKAMFSNEEYDIEELKLCNLYLKDQNHYNKLKRTIISFNPKFIIDDIFQVSTQENYDNIFMSNIIQYFDINKYKDLMYKLKKHLNIDGQLLLFYLYDINNNCNYDYYFHPAYNLKESLKLFKNIITKCYTFRGLLNYENDPYNKQDFVAIYKKEK